MIERFATSQNKIALTFDDGPDSTFTDPILEILERHNAKATFYMIGEHMKKYPHIVKKVAFQGHEIGNHTYHHRNLTELTEREIEEEIASTDNIIRELTNEKPTSFRPPFLAWNEMTNEVVAQKFSYPIISAANLSAKDWEQPGTDWIVNETRKQMQPGSILIFHDGLGDRHQTVEAMEILLTEYREDFQFVTVKELINE